jgi:hypothetical protein
MREGMGQTGQWLLAAIEELDRDEDFVLVGNVFRESHVPWLLTIVVNVFRESHVP